MQAWRLSPHAMNLSLRGTSFTPASKLLKRLQLTMRPLLEDMLIFDASYLQVHEDPLLTTQQRAYLLTFLALD